MEELIIKTLADIEKIEETPIQERMECFNTYDLIKKGAAINPEAVAISFIMSGDAYEEPMQVTYKEFVQQIIRGGHNIDPGENVSGKAIENKVGDLLSRYTVRYQLTIS
jgi:hypothetical protein